MLLVLPLPRLPAMHPDMQVGLELHIPDAHRHMLSSADTIYEAVRDEKGSHSMKCRGADMSSSTGRKGAAGG